MTMYTSLGYSPEVTSEWKNGPQGKSRLLLDRAMEHINSVPYEVTTRWLFYGLWQEGFWLRGGGTEKKKAYVNFCRIMSRLRHSPQRFQDQWPIELADDRRDPVDRGGFTSAADWLRAYAAGIECNVDRMTYCDNYVMVAFEAEAMLSQFKYITEPYGVTLWPFSGNTSIAYKKRLATAIEEAYCSFEKPVIVLYFGDLDPAGQQIPESAFRHVRKWCNVEFDAYWCGLTEEHVNRYDVESDDDKYQWEALRHNAAVEVITEALDKFCSLDDISIAAAEEATMTKQARSALFGIV